MRIPRFILASALSIGILLAAYADTLAQQDTPITRLLRSVVVQITSGESRCLGWVISSDSSQSQVATAKHCATADHVYRISTLQGVGLTPKEVGVHPALDMMLIRTRPGGMQSISKFIPIRDGETYPVLLVLSIPGTTQPVVGSAIIGPTFPRVNDPRFQGGVQVFLPAAPGTSGGLIVHARTGEGIGMLVGGLDIPGAQVTALGIVLPAQTLSKLGEIATVAIPSASPPATATPPPSRPAPTPASPPSQPAPPPSANIPPGAAGERAIFQARALFGRMTWINESTILSDYDEAAFLREVALINISTTQVEKLALGQCASLSPDRTRMAWVSGPRARREVWILDLRSMVAKQLTAGFFPDCVAWSPDGRRIAASHNVIGRGSAISILSAESGEVLQVIPGGDLQVDEPVWTPDGQRMMYSVYGGRRSDDGYEVNRIEVSDLRTQRRTKLVDVPAKWNARNLLFSPDGRTLLFDTITQIFVYEGNTLRPLVAGHSPAWHPDGRSISFAREGVIYLMSYRN